MYTFSTKASPFISTELFLGLYNALNFSMLPGSEPNFAVYITNGFSSKRSSIPSSSIPTSYTVAFARLGLVRLSFL